MQRTEETRLQGEVGGGEPGEEGEEVGGGEADEEWEEVNVCVCVCVCACACVIQYSGNVWRRFILNWQVFCLIPTKVCLSNHLFPQTPFISKLPNILIAKFSHYDV